MPQKYISKNTIFFNFWPIKPVRIEIAIPIAIAVAVEIVIIDIYIAPMKICFKCCTKVKVLRYKNTESNVRK